LVQISVENAGILTADHATLYNARPHYDAATGLETAKIGRWHTPATGTASTAPLLAFSALPDLRRRRLHRSHALIRRLHPIPASLANQQVLFQVATAHRI
jgi:hypothetical protein